MYVRMRAHSSHVRSLVFDALEKCQKRFFPNETKLLKSSAVAAKINKEFGIFN